MTKPEARMQQRRSHASFGLRAYFVIRHSSFVILLLALHPSARAEEKTTYANDVLPILRNSCLNCHNADKNKAGLDMTTYEGIMAGSDTRKVVDPGNSGNSILLKCITHAETPTMPPKSDKLPEAQIEIIRKWIDGHALETTSSQAVIAKNSGPALEIFAQEKADGPPPVPHDLLLEPVMKTERAGSVVSMAASPRAPIVAVAAQKQVLLYNTDTGEFVGVLPFPEGFPEVVKFSRDGRLVIAGGGIGAKSGRVVVWDVTTGLRVMEAGDEYDSVLAVDISPDRHLIALGGPNRMVKIFKDGKLLFNIKKHTDWVTALSFTPDGKMLISGDRQGGLSVWETSSGTELFSLLGHKAGVTAIVSPGPQTCITSSEDGTVKLWDLREGKELKSWEAHKGGALSVAFSPDGRLVTSGRDKIVRLWKSDGTKLKEFEPFSDVALSAAISGNNIIAGDWTGVIRIWNSDGKRLAELTPNPPLLAERVASTTARIAELQQARVKNAADLADAEKTGVQNNADLQSATQSLADKQKQVQAAQDKVGALVKACGDGDAALKKATADLAQLQTGTVPYNSDALQAAQAGLTTQTAVTQKLHADLAAAQQSFTSIKAGADAMTKTLGPKIAQAKDVEQKLAKAKHDAGQIDRDLATASSDALKWKAAELNIPLVAAKKELADRQADKAKATEAVSLVSADLDKANADLAAAEKSLAGFPALIKEKQDVIAQAQQALDQANAAATAAKDTIAQKQSLITQAAAQADALNAQAAQAPDDATRKDAAAKANISLALLTNTLPAARKTAADRDTDIAKAAGNLSSAQKALEQVKTDAAAAPGAIAKLRAASVQMAARTVKARVAAEKVVAAADKPIAAAQAKVDAIARDYEAFCREAEAANPAVTQLTKK